MPNARLETILRDLLRRYAPSARIPAGDLAALADLLAAHHALVMVGAPAASLTGDAAQWAQRWAGGYMALYDLLAGALFSALNQAHPVQAYYADDRWPAIVVMVGEVIPVVTAIAGIVAPFVAERQGETKISEAELTGVMEYVLEELEASDLRREEYRRLRDEGAALVRQLLTTPIHQMALTSARRALFEDTAPIRPAVPDDAAAKPAAKEEGVVKTPSPKESARPAEMRPPLPPTEAPEMPKPPDESPAGPLKGGTPIFFTPGERKGKPPLPKLPDDPKSRKR